MNRSRLLRGGVPRLAALAALLALAAALPAPVAHARRPVSAGVRTGVARLPVAAANAASVTGPSPQQLGLAPAPFSLLILLTDTGGNPLPGVTPTADPLYPGWCDLYNFSAGVSATPTGQAGAPSVSLGQFALSKSVDATSVQLFKLMLSGTAFNATFVIVRDTPDRIEAWKMKLTGAYVTGQNDGASSGGTATESDSFAYTGIEWDYLDTDATGKVIAQLYTSYNATTQAVTHGSRAAVYPGGADTDGDGITDGWEYYYGLNPKDPTDANADPDGDGQTNLQEFLAGTVPTDPLSALRMTAVGRTSAGGTTTVTVTWQSVANKTYVVESASSPAGPWSTEATVPSAGDGTTTQTVNPSSNTRFFYRVRVGP